MTPSLYPAHWIEIGKRYVGYIDSSGSIRHHVSADAVFPFSNGAARIKRAGKFGAIDADGNLIVDCKLASATDFMFGLSQASPDGITRGLIDRQGVWKLLPAARELSLVSDELYCSKEAGDAEWFLRTFSGEICAGPYSFSVGQLNCGRILVLERDKTHRFLDSAGRLAIRDVFTDAYTFSEDWALVFRNGQWAYINQDGESMLRVDFDEFPGGSRFHCGLAPVGQAKGKRNMEYFFINKEGSRTLGPYAAMKEFSCYGAAAKDIKSQRWGIIDNSGNWLLKPEWFLVDPFCGELARVFNEPPIRGKAHYINSAGKIVWIDGSVLK